MSGDTDQARSSDAPAPETATGGLRPWWLSALAGSLGMAVVLHLVVTAIFVAPDNPVKDAVRQPVAAYMDPMFQQNWSLFAPTPIGTGYSLWVRGWYAGGRSTEWVDATAVEVEANILHNVAPSRTGILSRRLSGLMRQQYNKLTDHERRILAADHLSGAWAEMDEQMTAAPERSSVGRISRTLLVDRAMTAYATQFAWAWWGRDDDIEHVQVRIQDTRAPNFADRDARPSHAVREFGRRPLYQYDRQDEAAFAEAIERFRA